MVPPTRRRCGPQCPLLRPAHDRCCEPLEEPEHLLRRLRLGREEFCQRLLTSLILQGPYPRWNTRSKPAPSGVAFLRALYLDSFGPPWPGDSLVFVDEFDLPARQDAERGGAPDYAVLWEDRIWMIELKTEKASHRRGQIHGYFDLGHHHHPDAALDILYVTPPMEAPFDPPAPWGRYAHRTWTSLLPLIRTIWPSGESQGEEPVVDGLTSALEALHMKVAAWRDTLGLGAPAAPAEPARSPINVAMDAATLTADDGQQRGVEVELGSAEDLEELRFEVRQRLAASPEGSALRHVMPWIWRWQSTGPPLTELGTAAGMELRMSGYTAPLY